MTSDDDLRHNVEQALGDMSTAIGVMLDVFRAVIREGGTYEEAVAVLTALLRAGREG